MHSWRLSLCSAWHLKQEACKLLLMTKDSLCTQTARVLCTEGGVAVCTKAVWSALCDQSNILMLLKKSVERAAAKPATIWPGGCELAFHLCFDKIIPTAWQPSSNPNIFKVLSEVFGFNTHNAAGFVLVHFFYYYITRKSPSFYLLTGHLFFPVCKIPVPETCDGFHH